MNKRCITCTTALLVIFGGGVLAENIDPDNDGSQYAWCQTVGWINFEPCYGGVTVSDSGLSGFAWGENIGWINLSPQYGGVFNDGYGNLSGFAWGENIGWINFDPKVPGDATDYGVVVDADGDFSGWAWGENIGWISFQSDMPVPHKVKACRVNFKDLANFAEQWLQAGVTFDADLSGDGQVDFVDYGILAEYWLDYCNQDWPLK